MWEKIRKINGSKRNGEAGKGEQLTYLTKFIFVALKDNLVHSMEIYLFFYKKN
jgi:phosphoribosylaminoimidazole-succinocarboxamide synthase